MSDPGLEGMRSDAQQAPVAASSPTVDQEPTGASARATARYAALYTDVLTSNLNTFTMYSRDVRRFVSAYRGTDRANDLVAAVLQRGYELMADIDPAAEPLFAKIKIREISKAALATNSHYALTMEKQRG